MIDLLDFDGEPDWMCRIYLRQPLVGGGEPRFPKRLALLLGPANAQPRHDMDKAVFRLAVGNAEMFAPHCSCTDCDQFRHAALNRGLVQVVDQGMDVEAVPQIG